ncbi:MAG: TetR/AcrR family transcriptional regulator [Hahellaceae bacterium]|jgi:AcrR family transcriptional regulator|nr:TetR/AcrR family transcriptional regulator [Hahellaceae bacterium]
MRTRDRILLASLELFNEKGERNITTNHVAAHLGISPGNLYYHFRNKSDIVYELFMQYQTLVRTYLVVPKDRSLSLDDKFTYLEAVFDGLWAFRFLHRDLQHFLEDDERLKRDYRAFTWFCLESVTAILAGLERAGITQPMDDTRRSAFALNLWLIVTNWMSFLKTASDDDGVKIDREALRQGIYQVVVLEIPYVQPAYLEAVMARQARYQPRVLSGWSTRTTADRSVQKIHP